MLIPSVHTIVLVMLVSKEMASTALILMSALPRLARKMQIARTHLAVITAIAQKATMETEQFSALDMMHLHAIIAAHLTYRPSFVIATADLMQ